MFGGSSEHTLDNNGRLIIPTRFRYDLGQSFIITKGIGCLCVFTKEQFRLIADEANKLASPLTALFTPDVVRLYRHLYSGMVEVTTDNQNRVQLTAEHKKHAGIEKEVLLVGMGDWLEIWSRENWEKYRETELTDDKVTASVGLLAGTPSGAQTGDNNGAKADAGIPQAGPA
jgi:MraZ protein